MTSSHQALKLWQKDFVDEHKLPATYVYDLERSLSAHVTPSFLNQFGAEKTEVMGVYGAQGSGKSTLAAYLAARFQAEFGRSVVVLSIDDFYLTRGERGDLAENVHPLLLTRGVPGTHDVPLLLQTLDRLCDFTGAVNIPRFDKLADDRVSVEEFDRVSEPVDLVILEGWCVGITPEPTVNLLAAVNELEAVEDETGAWRTYVNNQLRDQYQCLWQRLDFLWALVAPNFEAVYGWRLEQETKMSESRGLPSMSPAELARFVSHYERLTRHSIDSIPANADLCWFLDQSRSVVKIAQREASDADC